MERVLATEHLYLWAGGLLVLIALAVILLGFSTRRRGRAPRGITVGTLSEDWLSKHRDWRRRR